MRIEAKNLELAYKQASEKLNCSITQLDIKVIQHPNGGLFGLFRKNAIIEVKVENDKSDRKSKNPRKKIKSDEPRQNSQKPKRVETKEQDQNLNSNEPAKNSPKPSEEITQKEPKKVRKNETKPKTQITDEMLSEIKTKLDELFKSSDFAVSVIEVKKYDDDNVYIKLDGEDAALLIGKEGYRYKALSYMIYNWISIKYNLSIILEISEFLQNQERILNDYLNSVVIQKVKAVGKATTKPYDGALVKFAVDRLRAEFPDKYVGVRAAKNGKVIFINDNNHE